MVKIYNFYDDSGNLLGAYNVGENNPEDSIGTSINGTRVASIELSDDELNKTPLELLHDELLALTERVRILEEGNT